MAALTAEPGAPLGRLLLYVAAAVGLAALATPPVFWAGRWAVHTGLVPQLGPFGMPTYFRRALLVLLLAGAPWLWRQGLFESLRYELGAKLKNQGKAYAMGLLLSLVALAAMLATLWALDGIGVRPHGARLRATGQAIGTALVVGLVEELLFRGVFLTLAAQRLGIRRGHLTIVALFACLHFVAPATHGPVEEQVGWLGGFALLGQAFAPLGSLTTWLRYGSVLVVLGDTLGEATLRTRGLGLAIGLHTGLVFGARLTLSLGTIAPGAAALLTPDMRGGLAALALVLVLNGVVRLGWPVRHNAKPLAAHR